MYSSLSMFLKVYLLFYLVRHIKVYNLLSLFLDIWIYSLLSPSLHIYIWALVTYSISPALWVLKPSVTRFFASGCFHESSSPKPPKITLGSLRNFSKIRGNIHKWRCITGINDTCHRYQRHRRQILPPVPLVLWYRWQICHRYQQYRQKICRRCQQHRWQIMEQYQTADIFKWTWRKKFINMLILLHKGVQKN